MTPEELREAQNAITRVPVAAALGVFRSLPAIPLTPAQWARLILALFAPVIQARSRGVDLAREFYESQSPTGVVPEVPDPVYDMSILSKTLDRFARSGLESKDTKSSAEIAGAAAVGRHVEQAGREWVVNAADSENARFARVDPYGETCAFCRLLISRGPCYRSETSGGFQSHLQCTCIAVPVWDPGSDWPGKEQFVEAEDLYVRSTAGTSGKEAIRAFRVAVESSRTS